MTPYKLLLKPHHLEPGVASSIEKLTQDGDYGRQQLLLAASMAMSQKRIADALDRLVRRREPERKTPP